MAKSIGVICPRGRIKHEECARCALNPLRPCHLTPDMLNELRTDSHDIPEGTYTPTMLLGCDRQEVLVGGAAGGSYTDVEGVWPFMRGSMVHARMEIADYPGKYIIREFRLTTTVETKYGSVNFGGKPDLLVINDVEDGVAHIKVVDYKSTYEIGHDLIAAKDENMMQLNMYAWLVERSLADGADRHPTIMAEGFHTAKVVELEILYADMKRTRRFTSAGPLQARGKLIRKPETYEGDRELMVYRDKTYEVLTLQPIHLLPIDVTEAWIRQRIEEKIEAKQKLPPVLPESRRWMCFNCPVNQVCAEIAQQEEVDG
jgi:hypothetical protein